MDKVLDASGMKDSHHADTPACVGALGADHDGEPFNEE
jgi:hypothetical protein